MVLLKNSEKSGPTGAILERAGNELERLLVHLPPLCNVVHGYVAKFCRS